MEKFIKFKEPVNSVKDLASVLKSEQIIILRFSQMTNTYQIKVIGKLSDKEIHTAFEPLKIEKIYDEYPYPLQNRRNLFLTIANFISKIQRFLVFAK